MDEIIYRSAKDLAKAIRIKELSSLEIVDAHLRRIEDINPGLLTFVFLWEGIYWYNSTHYET
jgi:Asp-tRNA(Asn)/Glu-tRNA(Gln) amidotransferase A subunit family amidase